MAIKIQIELVAEPEWHTPEHEEKVGGLAPGFAKAVREQMAKAEGRWGWCSVRVGIKIHEKNGERREGAAYLGACSYLSAEDFIKNSGYFETKVKEALEDAAVKA